MFNFQKLNSSATIIGSHIQVPTKAQIVQMFQQHFSDTTPKKLGGLKGLKNVAQKLPFQTDKEYDVIVIGGGTGGISFA